MWKPSGVSALRDQPLPTWPDQRTTRPSHGPLSQYRAAVRTPLETLVLVNTSLRYGWRRGVWVPETPHMSRDLLIFVEQSSEPVAPSDGVGLARRRLGEWPEGSGLAERAVVARRGRSSRGSSA
jgi:hypothetical protein